MLLTNCACCAAPLPDKAKQCSRCKTRYCGPACQKEHWDAGGHKDLCRKIKKAGGAENYHADKKCKEAVAVAVEKCADDTAGQTCYICTQAVHWKTKEGLVRMCACRGTAGFAHVSCLAEQAKILMEEVMENNLGVDVFRERWLRWFNCSLCEQKYHGVVACALGWACWKTYQAETDQRLLLGAMGMLANGLFDAENFRDAASVNMALLKKLQRFGASAAQLLDVLNNLAITYEKLSLFEEALSMERDTYALRSKLEGEENPKTLAAASNYAASLVNLERFEEAKSLLRKTIPVARRSLGASNELSMRLSRSYAMALYIDHGATLDDLREAVTTLEETESTARRVLGRTHPVAESIEFILQESRAALRARETSCTCVPVQPSPSGSADSRSETPPSDSREDRDLDEVEDA